MINLVRRGFYADSVALMRLSREIALSDGIEDAALMMGTIANQQIMRDAGMLNDHGARAQPGDLIVAVRADDQTAARSAIKRAENQLDAPKHNTIIGGMSNSVPKSLRRTMLEHPDSNLALISVPGEFAALEAQKAIRLGINAMVFSDNVDIAAETALKHEAQTRGLIVMGPDCGTAIINGTPLAFANAVPRGSIGIIGASGTGIQEVSCLIAHAGGGVSQAIGTGGRDLKDQVGGISTLTGLKWLSTDPTTSTITLISKPPSKTVADKVIDALEETDKRCVVCFLGAETLDLPANAVQAYTLEEAASLSIGGKASLGPAPRARSASGMINGLYSGGTLCAEAQLILIANGIEASSNVPVPGAKICLNAGHCLIDLGDDQFTAGRPHPMIDPYVRDQALTKALRDPEIGIILLDCVLGTGSHHDPAGAIVACLERQPESTALIIASVTGTDQDQQHAGVQRQKLERAGIYAAHSNAQAARLACHCLRL